MMEWDSASYDRAAKLVGKRISQFTRQDATNFLSYYFHKTTTAVALAEGCNVSNGYPYWVFWFRDAAAS